MIIIIIKKLMLILILTLIIVSMMMTTTTTTTTTKITIFFYFIFFKVSIEMAMGATRSAFVITKSKLAQNINYQTRPQPATGFHFFKKTHPLQVLIINKLAMVSGRFFAGLYI